MYSIKLFLCLILVSLLIQCTTQDELVTDPYIECCSNNQPVEFSSGNSKVYMPSAFTPNDDGINDLFFPFVNEHVQEITSFSIFLGSGLDLAYISFEIDVQNPAASAWNGKDADGNKYAGSFQYGVSFTDEEGNTKGCIGYACSILCDSFAVAFNSKTDCFFPSQHDGQGGLDATLPTLEDDCF
jgi:hypothetical protein